MAFIFPANINEIMTSISIGMTIIGVIIHFIFAAAVAKDAGQLIKVGRTTYLVSGMVWAFATLVGGVFVAAIYWFMHHSTLARIKNSKFEEFA